MACRQDSIFGRRMVVLALAVIVFRWFLRTVLQFFHADRHQVPRRGLELPSPFCCARCQPAYRVRLHVPQDPVGAQRYRIGVR